MSRNVDLLQLLKELIQIGIALTSERDLSILLERILSEARRFTGAEAGTLFLREGDRLQFSVVQNDRLARELGEPEMRRRLQAEALPLTHESLASYVALTGEALNLPDVYQIPPDRPYTFSRWFDQKIGYRTQSVLVVPLQDPSGKIFGVLELINAMDEQNHVIPFHPGYEYLVRSLASQAAVAIRNSELEALSFTDSLTGVYNRRYLMLRISEEAKRHARHGQPVSVVLMDLDHFKAINDRFGHSAGDQALQEVAGLVLKHSRSFTVIARYGGDEFAALLTDTPKTGAVAYAERIRRVIEQHPFQFGSLTVSLGVACLPEDIASDAELLPAADRAMYQAKQLGRNRIATLAT